MVCPAAFGSGQPQHAELEMRSTESSKHGVAEKCLRWITLVGKTLGTVQSGAKKDLADLHCI